MGMEKDFLIHLDSRRMVVEGSLLHYTYSHLVHVTNFLEYF